MCSRLRQFVRARAYVNQWGIEMSHVNKRLFQHGGNWLSPKPKRGRDKKSASVRQADVPTNFNPIWPWQKIYSSTTKKSASVRQPLVSKGPRRNLLGYWDEKIWAGDIWESTDFEIYLRIGTSYRRKKIYSPPPSGFRSVKKDICFFSRAAAFTQPKLQTNEWKIRKNNWACSSQAASFKLDEDNLPP